MDYSFFNQKTNNLYPSVYKIKLDHPNELLALYSTIILPNTPICRVEEELAEYLTSEIEPTGWKAIWRASPKISGLSFKCDFLVNVINVLRNHLEASVVLERPLSIQLDELDDDNGEKLEIQKLITENRMIDVPIYELYIVNEDDPEELYLNSAILIENVRFFIKFIWRPWDTVINETHLNEIFVETLLESRLNLYFDVHNGILNQSQIKRVKEILTEGRRLRDQYDELNKRNQLRSCEALEDDKNDAYVIDELDISQAIMLKIKLENFDREMRMIEDPYLRPFTFYLKVDLDQEKKSQEPNDDLMEEPDVPTNLIHVVSKSKVNLNLLQLINSYYSDDEMCSNFEFEFYKNLKDAIKSAKKDERIAILPGTYAYETMPWIEKDLHIEGLTEKSDDVLIESSAFIDVLMHSTNNIKLKGLTLKCPSRDLVIVGDQFKPFRKIDDEDV